MCFIISLCQEIISNATSLVTTQSLLLTTLRMKAFQNIVGEGLIVQVPLLTLYHTIPTSNDLEKEAS